VRLLERRGVVVVILDIAPSQVELVRVGVGQSGNEIADLDLEVGEVRDIRDADPARRQAADLCSPQVVVAGHGDGVGGPGHRTPIGGSPAFTPGRKPHSL